MNGEEGSCGTGEDMLLVWRSSLVYLFCHDSSVVCLCLRFNSIPVRSFRNSLAVKSGSLRQRCQSPAVLDASQDFLNKAVVECWLL